MFTLLIVFSMSDESPLNCNGRFQFCSEFNLQVEKTKQESQVTKMRTKGVTAYLGRSEKV